jgi:transposase
MAQSSIHALEEIDNLITIRRYRCIYFPSYSLELNPIEQSWSIVKNSDKCSKFGDKEYFYTRTTEESR